MMSLESKVAVITGAGTGIGQGIALAIAKAGASIVVDYVGKAGIAQDTIDRIVIMGGKAIGVEKIEHVSVGGRHRAAGCMVAGFLCECR